MQNSAELEKVLDQFMYPPELQALFEETPDVASYFDFDSNVETLHDTWVDDPVMEVLTKPLPPLKEQFTTARRDPKSRNRRCQYTGRLARYNGKGDKLKRLIMSSDTVHQEIWRITRKRWSPAEVVRGFRIVCVDTFWHNNRMNIKWKIGDDADLGTLGTINCPFDFTREEHAIPDTKQAFVRAMCDLLMG